MRSLPENHRRVSFKALCFGIAALVVVLDQVTKLLAVRYLKPVGDFPLIRGVLHLTYLENTGAAFGMLKNARWVFMLISTAALLGVGVYLVMIRRLNRLLGCALALILGGGIGNMIDRIAYQYVVDFINFEWINFAVFNVADAFITIGACLIGLYLILYELLPPKKGAAEKPSAGMPAEPPRPEEPEAQGKGAVPTDDRHDR